MKTLIAIPCMAMMHTDFVQSLVNLTRISPPGTSVCYKQSSLVYDARNLLAITAMQNGYDRILWLDSDMTFPPDTLQRLSDDMDAGGYDLVTGLYVKRTMPTRPVLYKHIAPPDMSEPDIKKCVIDCLDYPTDTVFPVAGCGFGCVLTTTDLIRRLFDRFGPAFTPLPWASEDISFCYRATLIGAKQVCDPRIPLGHLGLVQFTQQAYFAHRGDVHE